jgi:purine catabolism regulator
VDGIAVGLGTEVTFDDVELSCQQAQRAITIAKARRGGLVVLPAYNSYVALALLGERAEQWVFSDTVLEALDTHDGTNPRQPLLPALQAFFDTIGSIERAASALGVHRHTMRARIAKISELTSRDLGDPQEYLELWLAIEFRRLAPGHSSALSPT